ncbi:hypothetical protein GCM10010869_47740 [Mesorhizobium tianshanense]|nr:hypothetical protein GCM10010869_47740 [Mesorhizobium tianshanense]
MMRTVRFADPITNKREQLLVPAVEQIGQVVQALMGPPHRGPFGKQIGTECDRILGHPPGKEGAAKFD